MVAQTQAQINFSGSGNLGQLISKLNDNVKNFGVSTGKVTKNFAGLNKEAKVTDGVFKSLSANVKSTADGFVGLGRTTKDTLGFFTTAGKNTLQFNDAITEANKGISGLGLKFLGLKKQTTLLNQVLDGPASHLAEIADAGSNTERAFIVLSKVAKPLRSVLKFLSEQAQKLAEFFVNLEVAVVRLIKGGISVAVKAIEFFSKTFQNLSQSVAKFGIAGKIVSRQFKDIGNSLSSTTDRAKEFNDSLDPNKLERVDKAGQKVSSVFERLSKGLETAAAGVILADTLGKVVRRFIGVRDSAQEASDTIVSGFQTSQEIFDRSGASTQLFSNKLTTASGSAQLLGNIFNNNLLKGLGAVTAKANTFFAIFQSIKVVTEGVADAAIQMSGLNDAFAQAQALGIDTTAAEIAFQFGLVGERLLFSAEAAKEFGRTAVTAFAQTEDAAAFVTTLSSGARLQFGELAEGLESVTAFSTELANSLDNTVSSGEAASALYNTLSAGVGIAADGTQDLTAQQNFLEASLKLSSGTGADAAQTLDLLAKTTKVYGLSANDAALTAAKLNQVVEQGQITFPQLTNQLGRTLATAEATNVTLDETLASVSALTKVQGEDALVGFTSLLSAIAGQGAQAQKEIQELGIQFDLQTVKSIGLNESLRNLVEATGGNAEVLKRIIPDTLAFQTALTLVNSVASDVDTTLTNIGQTGEDSLEAVFAAGQQSTIKQFTNIMNGFNEVLVDFGQRVQPALQPGLDALRGLLDVFQNLPEPVKNAIGLIVVAQTAISNIGGGLLSLGLTIGKLILSVVAFRLVNKALTGQLNSELDVIKQLVTVEKDYAGAITRLIGLNENFSSATIQTTKALNSTKNALSGLESQGFEISDDSLVSFERALESVRLKIKEVQRSPLKLADPEGTQKQLTTLKNLQQQIVETINTTKVARKLSLQETRKSIDDTLKEVNVTSAQRIDRFQELLLGLVNPNLVGGRSSKFQAEIKSLFNDTLGNASLSAEEKVGRIAESFRELRRDSPATVRDFLSDVEAELLSGFGRIESQSDKLRMTVKTVSEGLFANSPMAVKEAFDEAVSELEQGFTNIQGTLKERKSSLSEVFKRTIEALPEELNSLKPELVKETNKLLDASRGSINSRVSDFNKTFAKLVSGLPNELRQQAGEVKVATQELTRAVEAPLAGRDNFGVQFARAAVNLRNGVKTIEETIPVAENKLGELSQTVREKLGDTNSTILSEVNKIKTSAKAELVGAAASLIVEYEKLVPDDLENEVRDRFKKVRDSLEEGLENLGSGDISLDKFRVDFSNAISSIQMDLKDLVGREVTSEVEDDLGNFTRQVEARVTQINDEFDNIAGPGVRQEIKQNLTRIEKDINDFSQNSLDQVEKKGRKSFGALTDSLDGLGGVLSGFAPGLSSALDRTSTFLSSSRELSGGFSELSDISLSYTKNLKGVAAATGNASKAQGIAAATNKLLGRNMFGASASANAFAKAATTAGSSAGVLNGVTAIASAGMAGLSTAFTTATAAAGSFLATLAPLLLPIAAAGTALFGLFKIAQELFPAFGKLTDGNKKFAAQVEQTNTTIKESLDLFKEYKNSSENFGRDNEGNALSLEKMKEGLTEVNKEASDQRAPRAFVQGFRGAIINVIELLQMLPQQVTGFIATLPIRIGQAVGEGVELVARGVAVFIPALKPVVKAIETITNGIGRFGDFVENRFKKTNDKIRDFFNKVREDNQAFIAKEALAATQASSALTDALLLETDKVRAAQASGEVAAERSKAIVAAAEEANRALSAQELNNIIKEENQLARLSIELINEQIKAREEELEKAKDPTVKANLEFQLENLRNQSTALEKRNKLQEEFLRNQQAIGQNIQANNSAQSQRAVNQQLQETVMSLGNVENGGEKAQKIFSSILGVVKEVNDETGQTQFIRPETVNQASQAGRRAELAIQSTVAKVSSQIANLNNIDANLTQDDVAQGIFQVFDAVDKAVAEDPKFAQQGASILDSILTQGAEASGAEGTIANIFSPAQISELLERQTGIIETEFTQRTKAQEKSIKRLATLQEQGLITSVDAAQATAKAQESIDAERVRSIEQRIKAVQDLGLEGSLQEKDLISELAQFQIQSDLNRLNERRKILEEELNLLRAQKANEVQLLKNQNQEQLNSIQLTEKANQQEQKTLSARQNLVQAIGNFEKSILENRLKLTGDVEEQAEIQLEIAQQRITLSEQENAFERENIMLQQELNNLALEREAIQLRIKSAEVEAELAANNAKLAKVETLGLNNEEVEAIELQNDALTMQTKLLQDSEKQLTDFAGKQKVINDQELEALNLRQRAQKEANEVDLELAQRNRVIATFEKQIKQARTQAEIVKLTNQEREIGLQSTTQLIESQNSLLTSQKDLLTSTSDSLQKNFRIAIQAERNSFKRRRLEQQAAKVRLQTIKAQQKIEFEIFKLNEQQRDLALEIRQIQLAASKEQLEAELAVAKAQAAKAAADPTKTSEEIKAAQLGVQAARAQISATESQQRLLAQERAINAQQSGFRELQFRQNQENQVFEARADLAQTTLTRSDDRAIGREALERAGQQQEQLKDLINNFGLSLETLSNTDEINQTPASSQNIQGRVEINLNVSGDKAVTDRIDDRELKEKTEQAVFSSLEQLFDYTNRRNT